MSRPVLAVLAIVLLVPIFTSDTNDPVHAEDKPSSASLEFVSPQLLDGRWDKGGVTLPKEKDRTITISRVDAAAPVALSAMKFRLDDGLYSDWDGGYDAITSSTAPRTLTFRRKPTASEMTAAVPLWARQQVDASRADRQPSDGDPLTWELVLAGQVASAGRVVLKGMLYPGEIATTETKDFNTGALIQKAVVTGRGTGRPVEYVRSIGCEDVSAVDVAQDLSSAAGRRLTGKYWQTTVSVSAQDGLVMRDVQLVTRYMAKSISVPYVRISTPKAPASSDLEPHLARLTPASEDLDGRSRLVDLFVPATTDDGTISATYAIDKIPYDSSNCVLLTVSYSFAPPIDPTVNPGARCEPFGLVTCARFLPEVSFTYRSDPKWPADKVEVRTDQLLELMVDKRSGNAAVLTSDYDLVLTQIVKGLFSPVKIIGGNPMTGVTTASAIKNGAASEVDNFHQSWRTPVDEPSLFHPGCPECVHIHWRWSKASNSYSAGRVLLGKFGESGEGLPIIPSGSKQSVDVRVDPGAGIFTYMADSKETNDTFFMHGGWFSPDEPLTLQRIQEVKQPPGSATYMVTLPSGGATITRVAFYTGEPYMVSVEAGDTLGTMQSLGTVKYRLGFPPGEASWQNLPRTHARFVRLTWAYRAGFPLPDNQPASDSSYKLTLLGQPDP